MEDVLRRQPDPEKPAGVAAGKSHRSGAPDSLA